MRVRYPHKAIIQLKGQTQDENGDWVDDGCKIKIKGRYEPSSGNKNIDYTAKFYCPIIEVESFSLDEAKLIYKRKEFAITKHHNYQIHCEIWLS